MTQRWKPDTCDCILEYRYELPSDIVVGMKNEKVTWSRNGITVYEQEWRKSYPNQFCDDVDGKPIQRSNFNVINLPSEPEYFLRSIKKCTIHKGLDGKSLAEAVLNLNREVNRKRNVNLPKGILIGEIHADFIPDKTSLDDLDFKVKHSNYNFQKLKNTNPLASEFVFELDNFLSSTQSIFYHLLAKYADKYGLQIHRLNQYTFRKKAEEINNSNAIKFIDWYDNAYKTEILTDSRIAFLPSKRHLGVHRNTVTPDKAHVSSGSFVAKDGENKDIPIRPELTKWYFNQNSNEDVSSLCVIFLDKAKKMVNDAKSLFG